MPVMQSTQKLILSSSFFIYAQNLYFGRLCFIADYSATPRMAVPFKCQCVVEIGSKKVNSLWLGFRQASFAVFLKEEN